MIDFQMNKILLQSFHDVQIKPIYIFCEEKVSFSITCRRRHCEIILRFLSSTVMSELVRTEKNYIFGSTGNNSLIQTVKCSLFEEKKIPLNFHDVPITSFKTFLQGKAFFFHAPF